MSDTVSDPGLSVLQSIVCRITAREIQDDGHLYGSWGEINTETNITTEVWNTLQHFCPDLKV